ncbi:MAG: GAF domain-containing protein [Candidatus Wallbacteria bacterium]|nr:GAF domain-containing protein [Candidatus Wallbacteria bacterium]
MTENVPLGYGPPGRYRFPRAVNVVYSRKGDRLDLAVALDDGGRAARLQYSLWPSGKRTAAELGEVAFPGGGSGRAASFTVPATTLGVQLDFYDASGLRMPDLSCVLNPRESSLGSPPFTGEGYALAGPIGLGPKGSFARDHRVTLLAAKGEGFHIRGRFLVDDGGEALFVQTSDPRGTRVETHLLARATAHAPTTQELSFVAEPTLALVDFLDRHGQVLPAMSFVFDFRSGELKPQSPDCSSAAFRACGPNSRPQLLAVTCRLCKNDKPLAGCVDPESLGDAARDAVDREALPAWDMQFVCSGCLARAQETAREKRQLARLAAYYAALSSSVGLFLQAFFGVMQVLLPHGPYLYTLLRDTVPALAAHPQLLVSLTAIGWGFLFTMLPLASLWRAFVSIFYTSVMGSGTLTIASLAFQATIAYWVYRYLSLAQIPEFLPVPAGKNPLLWLNFYLYAVLAALCQVLFQEFFAQSLAAFADKLVRRGPGIASRVNRVFRRFQKLAGLHQEEEIFTTLKEILLEDVGVREYHVLISDDDRQVYVPRVSEGRALAEIASVRVARGDANFLGHAAMFGEMYGEHSLKNPDLRRVLSKGPLPCKVCVPVKVAGEVRALLNVARLDAEAYDSDTLAHLSTLASLLGLALTNARSHRSKDEQLARSQATLERELATKEELRTAFAKYVPPALIDRIMNDPDALNAEPERGTLTVLFTDLKGFSTLSEKIGDPTELARLLNLYLTAMTDIVFRHWGTLDKYVGDAVVAFFGWPIGYYPDHARRAVAAAIDMRDRMADLAVEMGHPDLSMRIGVNTGEMVVGNFGSAVRKSLTVLGDNVNLGARLEPTNKEYGTEVLVTGDTMAQTGNHFWAREIDRVRVVGRKTPVALYEPLAPRTTPLPPELEEMLAHYERALAAYRALDFAGATALFSRALQIVPEDGPSRAMLDRAEQYAKSPPPPGWDGVHAVKVK